MKHRTRAAVLGLLAAAAVPPVSRAAEPFDLTPLLNDKTMLVARVDLTQAKLPAAADWLLKLARDAKSPDDFLKEMNRNLTPFAGMMQARIDSLVKAGVTRAAVVIRLSDQGFNQSAFIMVVTDAVDTELVTEAVKPLPMTATELGGLTVWTPAFQAGDLVNLVPSPRPDLIDAVAKPDGTAILAAMAFPEAERPALLKTGAALDGPAAWPGPVSPLDNLKTITLRVQAGRPHATLVADAKNADAALAWINDANDPGRAQFLRELSKALPIKTAGNTLTIDMQDAEFKQFAEAAGPALAAARGQANQIKSASNIRQLLLACMMYANYNRGRPPAKLDDTLAKYLGNRETAMPKALMTNPQKPELDANGYVLVPAPETNFAKMKNPAQRLAIYEAGDFGDGVIVGFWDGHVEVVRDKTRFDALLKAGQNPPAAAADAPAAP